MIYVWRASWKPGLSREEMDGALIRRSTWNYPQAINLIGEYWVAGHEPAVISVFQTDDYAAIMEMGLVWGDVFKIDCDPACTPEQGLQWGPEIMQRRAA